MVTYLESFAAATQLNVRYETTVTQVARDEDVGVFRVSARHRNDTTNLECCRVVMATGFHLPRRVNPDADGVIEYYDDVPIDPDNFTNQEVLIIGKGNAAFEVAQAIYGRTARVHLLSRTRLKMAWETHYVGHARGVNNDVVDSYQLKSMDTVGFLLDATKLKFERDHEMNKIRIYELAEDEDSGWFESEDDLTLVDRVISCAGWVFDNSLFTADTKPAMSTDRYPLMTPSFESANVPGLFFAGTVQHGRDAGRSSGGFVHGFRYLIRALHRDMEARFHDRPWPSQPVDIKSNVKLTQFVLKRINEMSGPYQMFGTLTDVLLFPSNPQGETGLYYEEIPIDNLPAMLRRIQPQGPLTFMTVGLEYGRNFSGAGNDVFSPKMVKEPLENHPKGPGVNSRFLHPVLRMHMFDNGTRSAWLETAPLDIIRTAVENLTSHSVSSSANRPELVSLATQSNVEYQRLEDLVCPADVERGRNTCFETSATSEHQLVESFRIEFWEDELHIAPLGRWFEKTLGLRELHEDQVGALRRYLRRQHRSRRLVDDDAINEDLELLSDMRHHEDL